MQANELRQNSHEHRGTLLQHLQARHQGCIPTLCEDAPVALEGGVRFAQGNRPADGVDDRERSQILLMAQEERLFDHRFNAAPR